MRSGSFLNYLQQMQPEHFRDVTLNVEVTKNNFITYKPTL